MKILHMADLHLASKMETHLSKDKARERSNEMIGTFRSYLDYARTQGCEAVLIAGDLFDRKDIKKSTISQIRDILLQYRSMEIYCLCGNHDSGDKLRELSEGLSHVHLFGEDWTSYSIGRSGSKVLLTGAEYNGNNMNLFTSLTLPQDRYNILMLHGQDVEGKTEKNTGIIPLKALAGRNIDYLALGHIHKFKEGRLDSRGIYAYCGCMESRGFDETEPHGAILLDINEDTHWTTTKQVCLEARSCLILPIDVTECSSEIMIEHEARKAFDNISNHNLVKALLTGEVDPDMSIDLNYLEKAFEDYFYFLKWEDKTSVKIEPEKYKNDFSVKGEFVRTVLAADELSPQEKTEIIRIGIRGFRGEDLAYED